MKPSKKIPPSEWMLERQSHNIMSALNNASDKPLALFVGGCVRDILLGKKSSDIDIATKHTPDIVQKICEAEGFKVIPTGIEHGTLTVVVKDKVFEITTLRKDVETDGRRAIVAFSDSWQEDAERRDFTINTLLLDIEGNVYDPTEQGLRDLEKRHIMFVGNPEQRIQEDYLRILRFFRFHAYYGEGMPDNKALEACQKHADKIPSLSKERISQEFYKILLSEYSPDALELMVENNILQGILSEKSGDFDHLSQEQHKYNAKHLSALLFVVLGSDFSFIEDVAESYLVFTNQQKKFFKAYDQAISDFDRDQDIEKLIYYHGKECAQQVILLKYQESKVKETLQVIESYDIPVFPINGEDAVSLGIPQNKEMGEALKNTEKWWVSKRFQPTRNDLLDYLKALFR